MDGMRWMWGGWHGRGMGCVWGHPSPLLQYLESVRPLMDNEKYNKMETLAKEFKETIAPRLQKYLILKSWWTTNYVSQQQPQVMDGGVPLPHVPRDGHMDVW